MLKLIWLVLISCLVLLALAACGSGSEVKLEEGDDGSQVELAGGQTLVVRLEGNPTTGYTWETAEIDQKVLRQVGEPQFEADSDAAGSAGVQTLRFETVTSGSTTLKLVYARPWEEGLPPQETFTVQVKVR